MSISEMDAAYERRRLKMVIEEIERQLEKRQAEVERFRRNVVDANRTMWEEGARQIFNLDDAIKTIQYLDVLGHEKIKQNIILNYVRKLLKLQESAYFGRIDFQEEGAEKPESLYIGIAALAEEKTGDYLIYDWRAPVCSMFYDSEIGPAQYSCPEGIIRGELLLKRQYRIFRDKIEYMFDSSVKIDDEILQEILSRSVDEKMRTIVTSIQREQNRVIRDETHRLLVVQGPAGSGKTSIALHRVAYLLYRHRESITASNIVVFSPNQIFNDYISDVLPELGEENMHRTTFREYLEECLGPGYIIEDMNDQMEYLLSEKGKPGYEVRARGIVYKNSREFKKVLENYLEYLETEGIKFRDVYYRDNLIISKDDIYDLFRREYSYLPIAGRLDKIKNRILFLLRPYEENRLKELQEKLADSGEYVDGGEIKVRSIMMLKDELRPVRDLINEMTTANAYELYSRLFENPGLLSQLAGEASRKDPNGSSGGSYLPEEYEEICRQTVENLGLIHVPYEDAVAIAYFKGLLGDIPYLPNIKHVILDEAQDYSLLQYEILKQLFSHCNLTLLGDLNQSINPYMNVARYENIADIFGTQGFGLIKLTKSYRSTSQIMEFASRILKRPLEAEHINRKGEKPRVIEMPDQEALIDQIAKDIETLKGKGSRSIAIICRTARESLSAYERLKSKTRVNLVTKDDTEFSRGVVVIPSYLAKGLEFDAVMIYNAGGENYREENERNLLYTACTRALHYLYVYHVGSISPFLSFIESELYES